AKNGIAFITADHGNAEVMIDPITKEKHTSHTTNLVPGILTDTKYRLRPTGTLADITPTILSLLQIKQPESMTGTNLLIK
ncbi:MAG: 2,3-bisphosphoglycerate-independent phosphoglycerate mutase, partial [Patescibacteria group bacterium]